MVGALRRAGAVAALCTVAVLGEERASLRGRSLTDAGNDVLTISEAELQSKLEGFWVGQLVGNFMGLPFEFVYYDDPMPLLPDRYYDKASAIEAGLRFNDDDRGTIPARLNELQGAYTDDDTDIEFVTLHAVEQHGLAIGYPEIAEAWKTYVHINVNGQDALWFANKVARELMDAGHTPPATGSQELNEYWWTIDPQLVNEIWSAFYPGMLEQAVDRAEWGAQITSASWGTHPTRFYAALYSGAFFLSDVHQLYDLAMRFIPEGSPFLEGLWDVRTMYAENPDDWKPAWYALKAKYLHYPGNGVCGGNPWNCGVSAMINGVMGALALLYGGGEVEKTIGLAIAAGFDCDNQAATLGGLMGVMHGVEGFPRSFTHEIAGNNWSKPFNDIYFNDRRPPLPEHNTNTEIVARITAMTKQAIVQNGGAELGSGENSILQVKVSALLTGSLPPLTTPEPYVGGGCCSNCEGSPFCSDVSHSCYGHKSKDYYRECPFTPATTSEPSLGGGCCGNCDGSPFCSDVSQNCYGRQLKDYYRECGQSASNCCDGCRNFCSPRSSTCYDQKWKDYYWGCR